VGDETHNRGSAFTEPLVMIQEPFEEPEHAEVRAPTESGAPEWSGRDIEP
jgi:hypothetical protein